MNRVPAIVKGIALLLAVVALGVAIGWLSGGNEPIPGPSSNEAAAGPSSERPEPRQPIQMSSQAVPQQPAQPGNASTPAPTAGPQVAVPATSPTVLTNWEEKLDEILSSQVAENEKARQMAAVLPNLPEEGQVEVAQHLSNLVADEDYGMISGFLTNSSLPEAVLDVLIADSLNRPNAVKLPLLLDVAREPTNPKAPEAREILELFLDENYGDDWAKWQAKLQEWIANNPD